MFVIIDKRSSEFYETAAFVAKENPKTDIVAFSNLAKTFRTKENAQKFINKTFTDVSNYDIILLERR